MLPAAGRRRRSRGLASSPRAPDRGRGPGDRGRSRLPTEKSHMLRRSNRVCPSVCGSSPCCAAGRRSVPRRHHQPGPAAERGRRPTAHAEPGQAPRTGHGAAERQGQPDAAGADAGHLDLVVFVGLCVVLGRFAWKPPAQGLHQREAHLEHVLLETEQARNESEGLLADIASRWPGRPSGSAPCSTRRSRMPRRRPTRSSGRRRARPRRPANAPSATSPRPATRPSRRSGRSRPTWPSPSPAGCSPSSSMTNDHRRLLDAAIQELPARAGPMGTGGHDRMTTPRRRRRGRRGSLVSARDRRRRPATMPRPWSTPARRRDRLEAAARRARRDREDVLKPLPALRRGPGVGAGSPRPSKDRMLLEVFERPGVGRLVLRFLRVLNRHGRLGLLRAGPSARPAPSGTGDTSGPRPSARPSRSTTRPVGNPPRPARGPDRRHPDPVRLDRPRPDRRAWSSRSVTTVTTRRSRTDSHSFAID